MDQFIQQVIAGLGDGAIYASLALALVLIYRATHVINFAQGEMGMFSTYIAWALITHHGFGFWPAFFLTLAISFLGGAAIQQVVIRPLQRGGELTVVMATIALLVILNGLASWIWRPDEKLLLSPLSGGTWTVGDIARWTSIGGLGPRIVGSGEEVADQLQEWVEETDVDGFNLAYAITPGTFEDIVEYVVPELQARGAYQTEYAPGTLRNKLFGKGDKLPASHRAANYRLESMARL
jgi:hypothetical protein